jgi:hypothetical protein
LVSNLVYCFLYFGNSCFRTFHQRGKEAELDCCSFYASRVTLSSKSSKTKTLIWEFWLVAWNLLWITQDSHSWRYFSCNVMLYQVILSWNILNVFNSWISEPHPKFHQLPIEINIYIYLSCMSTWSSCYWTSIILLPRAWVQGRQCCTVAEIFFYIFILYLLYFK